MKDKKHNNRKRTKSRNYYFQHVKEKVDIFDNRLVTVKNKWYHKLLLRLRLVSWDSLVIAKDIKVGEKYVYTKFIRQQQPTKRQMHGLSRMVNV